MSEDQGFASIPRSMLYDPDVHSDAKLVFLVLSSHVGGNTAAWPSHQRIADLVGISKAQVKRMVRWLREHSYIEVVERHTDGGINLSNEYRLTLGSAQKNRGSGGPQWGQEDPSGVTQTPGGVRVTRGGVPMSHEGESVKESQGRNTTSSSAAAAPDPVIVALCDHLADRIQANGSKRPQAHTKRWHDACRLMIELDGKTPNQVRNMIDWCQTDEFWRANVLSMPKLRKQYDQMRLKALASPRPSETFQRNLSVVETLRVAAGGAQ